MSYAAYSTRHAIGEKLLPPPTLSGQFRFLSGLGALGDGASDAADAGIDPGTIATLEALGASDAQLEALANGQIDVPGLMNQLTGNAPAPGQPVTSAANFPSGANPLAQQSVQQTGYDLTDPASWYDVTGQLQQSNQQIKTLEALVMQNPNNIASVIGRDVINARNQYTDLAGKWMTVYGTAFGSTPGGLSGLGVVSIVVITTAIIATAAVVIAGLYVLNSYIDEINTKAQAPAQQAASTNQASLLAQYNQLIQAANAAAAANNTPLASQYLTTAQQLANQLAATGYKVPTTSPNLASLTQWFTTNWPWVMAAVVVVGLGPSLIKKL